MLFELIASGASSPLSVSERDVAALAACERGTILLDVSVRADVTLMELTGSNGRITLSLRGGRLYGEQVLGSDGSPEIGTEEQDGVERRLLDAEDALGLDDGRPHTIALTVNETGTHLYADGYECFSTTLTAFLVQIGLTGVRIDPDGIAAVTRLAAWAEPLSDRAVMAQSLAVTPMVQFAASELSARDARRVGALATGAIRALFRTRGRGQAGRVIAASGQGGTLHLDIDAGGLTYRVLPGADSPETEPLVEVRAPGHWDDGAWHDVVVTSARGAVEIHVDGYQVAHAPGSAFLADIAPVARVVVGADLNGKRLFGEVQTAMIYDAALTDAQIKRLAGAVPLPTRALFDTGYHGALSYRIPSLLTLDSGVILAGADQRVSIPNDAPNDINLVMRRSLDGGQTWEEMRTLLSLPGTGALGASLIDSVLVQDHSTGRVICLVDQFPGGIGQPNAVVGTGFDAQGRRVLHNRARELFAVEPDGTVVTAAGEPTDYRVVLSNDAATGARAGDVLLGGEAAGSIYLAYEQAPEECLFQHRSSHLLMITSDDDGATWSEPTDITAQLKADWMCFLGTGPGNAIQLTGPEHAGRILVPVYYSHEAGGTGFLSCAAIYSDDGGASWTLGSSPNDGREILGDIVSSRDLADERASLYESVLVEGADGAVHVWARNQHPAGRVAHAVSHDGGVTWGEVDYHDQLTEIFSQPNAIAVTGASDIAGAAEPSSRSIVFANASQMLPFRGCGVMRLSHDDGVTWPHNRVINPRHYVYQCMAQLPSGDIALLWEREWQGLFLTTVPLTWLVSSRSTIS
ncbi:sialidase family protein [Actinomyces sp. oral taxon 170]|uniref:sialidase family protein n=1 Tax=Actinomyces sp. oral taxon 170 TaxID=712117 RepID=UPI000205BD00|nr:sialidase family protein [Actinomyces sp. oral taxon 170]EGF56385.1 BNR/Asp-box repeat protein [Actinomyces sp. oral taxon 170 str. F0386]